MKSILTFTLLFFLGDHSVNAKTIDNFLSSTLLGQEAEKIEESHGLDQNTLQDIPSFVEVGELHYEGLIFKENVFIREGVCRVYGLYKNQLRNKHEDGRLKHKDAAEIYDVFQALHAKLVSIYGPSPRSRFVLGDHSDSGPLNQSYVWVNKKHALVLTFHDNISTQSITLRQYLRDEKLGEFTGEDEIERINHIYNSQSGTLPDDWPMILTATGNSESNEDSGMLQNRDPGVLEKLGSEGKTERVGNTESANQSENNMSPIIIMCSVVGIVILIMVLLFFRRLASRSHMR